MMIKDEEYADRIISRYRKLRKNLLSDEYLINYIEETITYLNESVDRNYAVWGYRFNPASLDNRNKLHPEERNHHSYEEAVAQLKDELLQRLAWLDKNIEVLKQYSHESAVKKYNH